MSDNTFSHKIDDQLPDPTMDRHLVPCPECGAKPNNIHIHRKGPTILCYTANSYRVVCLKCWHKGRPGRTAQKALENWNKGKSKITIKQLRENLGWSQNELANRANVSTDSISMWETGHRIPSKPSRYKLARALGVKASDI